MKVKIVRIIRIWQVLFWILVLSCDLYNGIVKFNLNECDEEDLILMGVSVEAAKKIIDARRVGPIKNLEVLKNIPEVTPFYNVIINNFYVISDLDYRIRPGDILEWSYEGSEIKNVVGPDGKCDLGGTVVKVAGLTIDQVREMLYRQLGVAVSVRLFKTTGWIYVIGDNGVVEQKDYQVYTLLELMAKAQVVNSKFNGEVIIYRGSRRMKYNVNYLLANNQDVTLLPDDKVYFKKKLSWKLIDFIQPIASITRDIIIVLGVFRILW